MSKKALIFVGVLITALCIESWLIYKLWTPENHIIPNSSNLYFSFSDTGGPDDFVSIDGTWYSETDLAFPIQGSNIQCWRDKLICNESQGYIYDSYLFVDTNIYDLQSWNEKEIIAVYRAACKQNTLKIDRSLKQATLLTEKISNEGACAELQSEPIISTLMKGYDAHLKLQEN